VRRAAIGWALLLLLTTGCGVSTKRNNDDSSIALILGDKVLAFQQELKSDPDNIELNRKLLFEYINAYENRRSPLLLDLIYQQGKAYLALVPNDERMKVIHYDFMIKNFILYNRDILHEMRTLYTSSNLVDDASMPPPSAVEVIKILIKNESDLLRRADFTKGKLKDAVRENPAYLKSYKLLSSIYENEQQYDLGIAVLKRGLKENSEDAALHQGIGRLYKKKAIKRNSCSVMEKQILSQSLKAYNTAMKLDKSNTAVLEEVVELNSLLGRGRMALFFAKKYHDTVGSNYAKLTYAQQLIYMSNLNKTMPLVKDVLQVDAGNEWAKRLQLNVHFLRAEWPQYLSATGVDLQGNMDNKFYYVLREYLARRMTGKRDLANGFLLQNSSGMTLSSWEHNLREYFLGELTSEKLFKAADDVCKKTEANFYVGFNAWLNKDTKNARLYFNSVVKNGHPRLIEYVAAKNLLPKIRR